MLENSPSTPLAHSPDGAALRISVATRSIYELIAKGEIRSFKSGKRRLIPDTELVNYVQRKMNQAVAA